MEVLVKDEQNHMEPVLSTAGNIASIVSLLIVVIPMMSERARKIITDGGVFKAGFGILILAAIALNVTVLYERYAYRAAGQPEAQLVIPHLSTPPVAEAQPPPAISKEDRIFIGRDPKEIKAMLEGKMQSEQSRIIAPFIGKWMNLSVFVDDVAILPYSGTIYSGNFMESTKIIFRFNRSWIPRLEVLNKGQRTNVVGKITEINNLTMTLEDCELP